ncbi:MAG TPA: hypothetical protein VGP68_11655, partial [Gemmataceae bacterium]|nr:hypothetical protein [Gemmataceae bacterium]
RMGSLRSSDDPDRDILWLAKQLEGNSMQTAYEGTAEAAILSRLVRPEQEDLSVELARAILAFDYDDKDRQRMHELAVKNQEGKLTEGEEQEIDGYRRIGYFVELMRSKARMTLKKLKR